MQLSMRFMCVTLALLTSTSISFGQANLEKARLARVTWAAFRCVTYAELFGNEKEQARLFEVGAKAGREFIDALHKGQMGDDAMRTEVPAIVIPLLRGPSADFILGRIFQDAKRSAKEETVKGQPWDADKALIASNAQTKYLTANCVLLK